MPRPHRFCALLGCLLLAGLVGCTAHKTPSAFETKLANLAKDVAIPLQAQTLLNPTPDSPLSVAQGMQVYAAHCALCHSSDGHSQNALGLAMYPPAMDLTSPHVQAWKDAELFWIVNNGIRLTGMPGWEGVISPNDNWKLARFIHALPKLTPADRANLAALANPVPPSTPGAASTLSQLAYGKRLTRQEGCLECHRIGAEGNDAAPYLTHEVARHRSAAWLLGHFKNPPAFVPHSEMPAFDNLTPAQLQALIAYLQSLK